MVPLVGARRLPDTFSMELRRAIEPHVPPRDWLLLPNNLVFRVCAIPRRLSPVIITKAVPQSSCLAPLTCKSLERFGKFASPCEIVVNSCSARHSRCWLCEDRYLRRPSGTPCASINQGHGQSRGLRFGSEPSVDVQGTIADSCWRRSHLLKLRARFVTLSFCG